RRTISRHRLSERRVLILRLPCAAKRNRVERTKHRQMPRLRADIGNIKEYLQRQFVLDTRAEVVYRRNVTILCELCNLEREQTSSRTTNRCNVSIINLV